MIIRRFAASVMACIVTVPVAWASEPVRGSALVDLLSGRRVYLSTPLGGEFPLHYRQDGSVTGDGTKVGLGRFFAPRETGRWWVDGSKVCQKWPTWYDGRTYCFEIRPAGEGSILWTRDDGTAGQARIN